MSKAHLSHYKGRILLFSYAFPPMQVQMTPAVYKPMAAIARCGFEVDVICADSFSPYLGIDDSLLPFANETFRQIIRLNPPTDFRGQLQRHFWVFSHVPDLMTVLHSSAYEQLMSMDLSRYDAIMTWSPFHSINSVMVRIKKQRKNIRWLAQFCDPWAGNPLEISNLIKLWNWWHEPRAITEADFIVHSSRYSLELMLKNQPESIRKKTDVLPHSFNRQLYPQRPKVKNEKIIMRYLGVLYGRRSPEPLFKALSQLFQQRPDLKEKLVVELIGSVPTEMLNTPAALALPKQTVTHIQNVNYIQSLQLMYDADVLLLIEADIRQNLFLPSKLSDYLGADTPIVGLVPPGASEDAVKELGCKYARPFDIDGICKAVESTVDHLISTPSSSWCNTSFRESFSDSCVASKFIKILEDIQ